MGTIITAVMNGAYTLASSAQLGASIYSNTSKSAFLEAKKVARSFHIASAAALAWQVCLIGSIAFKDLSAVWAALIPFKYPKWAGLFGLGGAPYAIALVCVIGYVLMSGATARLTHALGPNIDLNPPIGKEELEARRQPLKDAIAAVNTDGIILDEADFGDIEKLRDVRKEVFEKGNSLSKQQEALLEGESYTLDEHGEQSYELSFDKFEKYTAIQEQLSNIEKAFTKITDEIIALDLEANPPQVLWGVTPEQHRAQVIIGWQIVASIALIALGASPLIHGANLLLQLGSYAFVSRPKSIEFKYKYLLNLEETSKLKSAVIEAHFLAHFLEAPTEETTCLTCLEEIDKPSPHAVYFGCDPKHSVHASCVSGWIIEKMPGIMNGMRSAERNVNTVTSYDHNGKRDTHDEISYALAIQKDCFPSCMTCRSAGDKDMFSVAITMQEETRDKGLGISRNTHIPTTYQMID